MWQLRSVKAYTKILKISKLDSLSRSASDAAVQAVAREALEMENCYKIQEISLTQDQSNRMQFLIDHHKFDENSKQKLQLSMDGSLPRISCHHSYVDQVENKIQDVLKQVKAYSFDIESGVAYLLNIYSTKNILDILANGNNILIKYNPATVSGQNSFTAFGFKDDIIQFEKHLEEKIKNILYKNYELPIDIINMHNDELRGLLKRLNQCPNTHVAAHNREVSVWTRDESAQAHAVRSVKQFLTVQSADCEETLLTTVSLERHILQHSGFGKQGLVGVKSYDGNNVCLSIQGSQAAVSDTVREIKDYITYIQRVEVFLSPQLLKELSLQRASFWKNYHGFRIKIPSDKKSPVVIIGPKDNMNTHLLELYKIMSIKSPEEFINMEKSVSYEFPDQEHFNFASNKLKEIEKLFSSITTKIDHLEDGLVKVKLTSSNLDNLCHANNFLAIALSALKYQTNYESVLQLAKLLQSSGEIPKEVTFFECSDGLFLAHEAGASANDAKLALKKAIEQDGILHQTYKVPSITLSSERLVKEIKSIAEHLEIIIGSIGDGNNTIESFTFAGNEANLYKFRQYLENKFHCPAIKLLEMPADGVHRKLLVNHLETLKETWPNAVLQYNPAKGEHSVGAESAFYVNSIQEQWRNTSSQLVTQEFRIEDTRLESCLLNAVAEMQLKHPEVTLEVNNKEDHLTAQLVGFPSDAEKVGAKLQRLLSKTISRKIVIPWNNQVNHNNRVNKILLNNCGDKVEVDMTADFGKKESPKSILIQLTGDRDRIDLIENLLVSSTASVENGKNFLTRTITLPYNSQYYLNVLQNKLGIHVDRWKDSGFRVQEIFPKVQCWRQSGGNNDLRIAIQGEPEEVRKTVRTINTAMENTYFHSLQMHVGCYKKLVKVMENIGLWESISDDDQVFVFKELNKLQKGGASLNIFGFDRQKVEDLHEKLTSLASQMTAPFHKEFVSYEDMDVKHKLLHYFRSSQLAEEMNEKKNKLLLDYSFNKTEKTIKIFGNKDLVKEYTGKVEEFLSTFTFKTQMYEDRGVVSQKLRNARLRDYFRVRWSGVKFDFNITAGSIDFWGSKKDVAEIEEFFSNDVRYVYAKRELDSKIKPDVLYRICYMYKSVFIQWDTSSDTRVISGYKPDIDGVLKMMELMRTSLFDTSTIKFEVDDKIKEIPTSVIFRVIPSSQFKNTFPGLGFYLKGDQLFFKGPKSQIEDATSLLNNIDQEVLDMHFPVRSATLLKRRHNPAGVWKMPPILPEEVFGKVFLSKKEKADSSKVLVYGTPEDIVKLRDYIDNTLPHLDLESDTIPLTAIQRHMLRSPKVHDQIFQDFYDEKLGWSYDLNSLEIAGDEMAVAQLRDRVYRYLEGIHIETVPAPDEKAWVSFNKGGSRAALEKKFPQVTLFVRHNDVDAYYAHIIGPEESVLKVKQLLLRHFRIEDNAQDSADRGTVGKNWGGARKVRGSMSESGLLKMSKSLELF